MPVNLKSATVAPITPAVSRPIGDRITPIPLPTAPSTAAATVRPVPMAAMAMPAPITTLATLLTTSTNPLWALMNEVTAVTPWMILSVVFCRAGSSAPITWNVPILMTSHMSLSLCMKSVAALASVVLMISPSDLARCSSASMPEAPRLIAASLNTCPAE